VSEVLARAAQDGLGWPFPPELDETALQARLSPDALGRPRIHPDPATIHQELRRKGVTLQVLWLEDIEQYPTG
jgi:hypothetical protein